MANEMKDQIEKVDVSAEGSSVYTVKVIKNAEIASEKQPARRGKDKRPRKITEKSLINLKPFQSISDINKLNQYTRNPYQKQGLSWKFWIVLLIILGIIAIGYVIWSYFKKKREQSYSSD